MGHASHYYTQGPLANGVGTYTYGLAGQPNAVTAVTGLAPNNVGRNLAYQYDAAGNRISATDTVGPDYGYVWDALGRLTTVTQDGTTSQENIYGEGRDRILQRTATTITLYLPNQERELTIATGNIEDRRTYTIGNVAVATRTSNTGQTDVVERLLGNHQGSITLAVDVTTAQTPTTKRRLYDPYGRQRTTDTIETKRAFVGQTHDNTTGLNYLNNRYQDPTTGTFLSVDPLVATTGHPYDYANNNPITGSDPSGLVCKSTGDCAGTSTTVVAGNSPAPPPSTPTSGTPPATTPPPPAPPTGTTAPLPVVPPKNVASDEQWRYVYWVLSRVAGAVQSGFANPGWGETEWGPIFTTVRSAGNVIPETSGTATAEAFFEYSADLNRAILDSCGRYANCAVTLVGVKWYEAEGDANKWAPSPGSVLEGVLAFHPVAGPVLDGVGLARTALPSSKQLDTDARYTGTVAVYGYSDAGDLGAVRLVDGVQMGIDFTSPVGSGEPGSDYTGRYPAIGSTSIMVAEDHFITIWAPA